jgi:hypothetical protein
LKIDKTSVVYDFEKTSDLSGWSVIDDGVMGGNSKGNFSLKENSYGYYYGEVSLENNGGFSSLKYQFKEKDISCFTKVKIEVKGDGKQYQFRIKKKAIEKCAYISLFSTTKEWQTITFLLSDMYPTFKGKKLEKPNLIPSKIEQIGFLIANKTAENFSLKIRKIYLE